MAPQRPTGNPILKKLENLIFVDRIDRYKAEQGSLSAAIITEMQRMTGTSEIDEKAFQKMKSQYERYKKIPTIEKVVEGPNHYEVNLYASKLTLGERPIARGTLHYKFPKK